MTHLVQRFTRGGASGMILAIALLLPGGTLIAFALWAFQRAGVTTLPRSLLIAAALGASLILPGST